MTTKIKNIINKVTGWFFVILAMAAFALFAVLLGEYLKDKLWTLLVLDGLFYLCLWFLIKNARYFSDQPDMAVKLMITIFVMALLLFVLAAATLGLFDILWARLNIPLFFFGIIATICIEDPSGLIVREFKNKLMKKNLIGFVLICMSLMVFSQERSDTLKLGSLSLSSGQGPLSNGIFFEANFLKGNDILNVSIGERDMYVVYLKGFGSRFNIGPSVEWYYNIPLLGIMSTSTPLKIGDFSLSTMTWGGISAGDPGGKIELLGWRWLFFWQSIDLNYKNLTITNALINFDGAWGPLVDVKYKQPIIHHFTVFGSAGYSWYKPETALLKLGLIYTP